MAMAVGACNVTKRLPPGEKLYIGADVTVQSDSLSKSSRKEIETDLASLVRPKPNSSILGVKFKLWVWQVVGEPKKEKGLRNWLRRKLGEPPVYASSVNLERNTNLLNSRMENKGYFQSQGTADSIVKRKTMHAKYTVLPGDQYTVKKLVLPVDSTTLLGKYIKQSGQRRANTKGRNTGSRSLIKVGKPYDLDVIIAERERVDNFVKQRGFYYFNPDYLLMRVDSTVGQKKVDVFVTVKPETPETAEQQYKINNIFIYPNFSLGDTAKLDTAGTLYISKRDTSIKFYVIDPEKKYKPQIFERAMLFKQNDLYNRNDHNLSLNRLVNVGTFKFVKNRFEMAPITDSPRLDVFYYLTPQKAKSLRTELTAKTNTAGFNGSELEVSWRHRNTFRGAELLTIKATGGMDFQINGQYKGYNVYRFGSEASLTWPRIFPIHFNSNSGFVPRTKLTLGYDWQKREKLYTLNTLRGSFGYLWKETEKKEHELNIFNITYVHSSNVTQEYLDQVALDSTLGRIIEKQLIIGPTYSFTYNSNPQNRPKKNAILYNGKLDLSANAIGLIQGANVDEGKPKTILDVQYSQYVKTEQDLRFYRRLNKSNQWATRLFVGYGFPYGNSSQLPFIKQFFSGGPNGLRGFRVRTLGPGTYKAIVPPGSFAPDQTGDIKLELNSELRFKIVSIVNGGLFVDAGNIWLKNENANKPGAKFSSSFLKEVAADMGFGLRFDLSILILRTDLAIPIRKPWLPDGQRWVLSDIDFGNSTWRKENLVFNLAIGLPF
jgi:outer membrane protein insertion porin family